eukprot:gene496-1142_t
MSSPMYSLNKDKKTPLLPGRRRAVPFKQSEDQTANLDEHEIQSRLECNHPPAFTRQVRQKNKNPTAPNDHELLSAVMQRLSIAEKNLASCQEVIREKVVDAKLLPTDAKLLPTDAERLPTDDKRIKILDEKCKIMDKARGYGDDRVLELERKCQSLQSQIHEMELFLEDYGMTWVGPEEEANDNTTFKLKENSSSKEESVEDNGHLLSSSRASVWHPMTSLATSPKPFRVDFDLIAKNVEELNTLAGEGEHVISHTTRGARLKVKEPVPLTLYANGIFMFNGPFRPYTDTETQVCVKDLMDGYFPSELQSRYPNGIPILLKDMRDTVFRDKRQEKYFTGTGKQLLSDSTANESQEYTTTASNIVAKRDKALDTNGLAETSVPPRDQRQTVDQFLNKLPASVIKSGKIVDVRSGLKETLKGSQSSKNAKDNMIIVDTQPEQAARESQAEVEKNTAPQADMTTLRIKSATGDKTYVLKMKYTNTIGDVRRHIDKLRLAKTPNYQLKTAFPNRTYDRINATLEECELVPNATLHLLVTRR